ncbi:hypothetical protein KP509_34G055000 [Ceratopteris richardii]|nr:hypothetical protein KP509_34G055000 [Ceratopteris richardii]
MEDGSTDTTAELKDQAPENEPMMHHQQKYVSGGEQPGADLQQVSAEECIIETETKEHCLADRKKPTETEESSEKTEYVEPLAQKEENTLLDIPGGENPGADLQEVSAEKELVEEADINKHCLTDTRALTESKESSDKVEPDCQNKNIEYEEPHALEEENALLDISDDTEADLQGKSSERELIEAFEITKKHISDEESMANIKVPSKNIETVEQCEEIENTEASVQEARLTDTTAELQEQAPTNEPITLDQQKHISAGEHPGVDLQEKSAEENLILESQTDEHCLADRKAPVETDESSEKKEYVESLAQEKENTSLDISDIEAELQANSCENVEAGKQSQKTEYVEPLTQEQEHESLDIPDHTEEKLKEKSLSLSDEESVTTIEAPSEKVEYVQQCEEKENTGAIIQVDSPTDTTREPQEQLSENDALIQDQQKDISGGAHPLADREEVLAQNKKEEYEEPISLEEENASFEKISNDTEAEQQGKWSERELIVVEEIMNKHLSDEESMAAIEVPSETVKPVEQCEETVNTGASVMEDRPTDTTAELKDQAPENEQMMHHQQKYVSGGEQQGADLQEVSVEKECMIETETNEHCLADRKTPTETEESSEKTEYVEPLAQKEENTLLDIPGGEHPGADLQEVSAEKELVEEAETNECCLTDTKALTESDKSSDKVEADNQKRNMDYEEPLALEQENALLDISDDTEAELQEKSSERELIEAFEITNKHISDEKSMASIKVPSENMEKIERWEEIENTEASVQEARLTDTTAELQEQAPKNEPITLEHQNNMSGGEHPGVDLQEKSVEENLILENQTDEHCLADRKAPVETDESSEKKEYVESLAQEKENTSLDISDIEAELQANSCENVEADKQSQKTEYVEPLTQEQEHESLDIPDHTEEKLKEKSLSLSDEESVTTIEAPSEKVEYVQQCEEKENTGAIIQVDSPTDTTREPQEQLSENDALIQDQQKDISGGAHPLADREEVLALNKKEEYEEPISLEEENASFEKISNDTEAEQQGKWSERELIVVEEIMNKHLSDEESMAAIEVPSETVKPVEQCEETVNTGASVMEDRPTDTTAELKDQAPENEQMMHHQQKYVSGGEQQGADLQEVSVEKERMIETETKTEYVEPLAQKEENTLLDIPGGEHPGADLQEVSAEKELVEEAETNECCLTDTKALTESDKSSDKVEADNQKRNMDYEEPLALEQENALLDISDDTEAELQEKSSERELIEAFEITNKHISDEKSMASIKVPSENMEKIERWEEIENTEASVQEARLTDTTAELQEQAPKNEPITLEHQNNMSGGEHPGVDLQEKSVEENLILESQTDEHCLADRKAPVETDESSEKKECVEPLAQEKENTLLDISDIEAELQVKSCENVEADKQSKKTEYVEPLTQEQEHESLDIPDHTEEELEEKSFYLSDEESMASIEAPSEKVESVQQCEEKENTGASVQVASPTHRTPEPQEQLSVNEPMIQDQQKDISGGEHPLPDQEEVSAEKEFIEETEIKVLCLADTKAPSETDELSKKIEGDNQNKKEEYEELLSLEQENASFNISNNTEAELQGKWSERDLIEVDEIMNKHISEEESMAAIEVPSENVEPVEQCEETVNTGASVMEDGPTDTTAELKDQAPENEPMMHHPQKYVSGGEQPGADLQQLSAEECIIETETNEHCLADRKKTTEIDESSKKTEYVEPLAQKEENTLLDIPGGEHPGAVLQEVSAEKELVEETETDKHCLTDTKALTEYEHPLALEQENASLDISDDTEAELQGKSSERELIEADKTMNKHPSDEESMDAIEIPSETVEPVEQCEETMNIGASVMEDGPTDTTAELQEQAPENEPVTRDKQKDISGGKHPGAELQEASAEKELIMETKTNEHCLADRKPPTEAKKSPEHMPADPIVELQEEASEKELNEASIPIQQFEDEQHVVIQQHGSKEIVLTTELLPSSVPVTVDVPCQQEENHVRETQKDTVVVQQGNDFHEEKTLDAFDTAPSNMQEAKKISADYLIHEQSVQQQEETSQEDEKV